MSQIKEAIEKLEEALSQYLPACEIAADRFLRPIIVRNRVDQALVLLRAEEPKAGEFSKRCREFIKLSEEHLSKSKVGRLRTYGKEACDIIDRQAQTIKSHDGELGAMSIVLASYKSDINRQAAELKEKVEELDAECRVSQMLLAEVKKLQKEKQNAESSKEFELLEELFRDILYGCLDDKFQKRASNILSLLRAKDEKFNTLANQVIDMSHAITGWREGVAFDNEGGLIDELERMVNKALKLAPQF